MAPPEPPAPLWEPSAEFVERTAMTRYMRWLAAERGVEAADYGGLWQWSVAELEDFWASIWDYFDVRAERPYERVLGSRALPGADWFPGARLSYAEHIFRGKQDGAPAIHHASELRELETMTWGELRSLTAHLAGGLRALGVVAGDRVVAYMPNLPEAVAAFLACASIGATWSSCSPDFGARSVSDRFAQIEAKVLLAVDGYRYGGSDFDRMEVITRLEAEMASLEHTIVMPYLSASPDLGRLAKGLSWSALLEAGDGTRLSFSQLPFDHPLWVLYSSGTTGPPKAIVHSQGGILLEHLKKMHLHIDAREGDRVFWFTTTGWMMWNFLVGVLLTPAEIVLYDGSPAAPDLGVLWDLAERTGMTCFGTSAAYIGACMKEGLEPGARRDLAALRSMGSTGSPLSPEGFRWAYGNVREDIWLFSTSGGTDVCTAFVGGCPLLPVHAGELQARALGAKVEAFDERGGSLVGEVGELVITERGTAIIYGRSDSTINRGGVRIGTSEIYRAVLGLDDVVDALVVDVPREGEESWMPLFVVLRHGVELDEALARKLLARVREECSPRHVPNDVIAVAEVPRTLSGKVLEVPVKRILAGTPPDEAASRDSLRNPAALEPFVALAGSGGGRRRGGGVFPRSSGG